MAPRQGSTPQQHIRDHHHPRRAARLRPPAAPDGAGDVGGAPPAPAGAAHAGQPVGADVGGRSQLRPALPHPPHRPPQAGHDAPAARPCQPHHLGRLRPHPAAVAVLGDRRLARGQERAHREAAPHDRRRRGRGAVVDAVPRPRSGCPRAAPAGARAHAGRGCRHASARPVEGAAVGQPAAAAGPHAPGEGSARRPHRYPRDPCGRSRHRAQRDAAARRH